MGYNFGKRLTDLKKQTNDDLVGRWPLKRTCFLAFISICFLSLTILPSVDLSKISNLKDDSQENDPNYETNQGEDLWIEEIKITIKQRTAFLANSLFVITPASSTLYAKLASGLDHSFNLAEAKVSTEEAEMPFVFADLPVWWNRMLVGGILRISFVLLCATPYWILGAALGYWLLKSKSKQVASETILGVCDRGNGPFYSGIYGPYRPNNSFSATELSCPGLACPPVVEKQIAESHKLAAILKDAKLLNQTNLELIRIILAHKDFPHVVAEENSIQREEVENPYDNTTRASHTSFFDNKKGNLADGAVLGLSALLDAHTLAKKYVESLKKRNISAESLERNYSSYVSSLSNAITDKSEQTKSLLLALTPKRLWAISEMQSELIVSSYLSTEAGKSLVYKRLGKGYTQISMYPHLQARAVLGSIPAYHNEYNSDQRLIVRQAIISSRRHGDFGRSFLPIKMPLESRALRDWLEILYADKDRRQESASLVELDGHMEEIHVNFKDRYIDKFKAGYEDSEVSMIENQLLKGIAHKSVVLVPLEYTIDLALGGFHQDRLTRVLELLEITRKYQTYISTSARLPGFKRQAMEVDRSAEDTDPMVRKIKALPKGEDIFSQWRIVRRMLTRYNWLSTRVGDDSVPIIGLVHGLLKQKDSMGMTKNKAMDALVPLRQRRYPEILGKSWENHHFSHGPTQDQIEVFVKTEKYENKSQGAEAVFTKYANGEQIKAVG